MIASLLLLAEALFRDRLSAWGKALHMVALACLAAAWSAPLLLALWRRRRARGRSPIRPYWRCACGRDNPPEAASCGGCAAARPVSWVDSPKAQLFLKAAGRLGAAGRALGLAVLYLLPLPALLLLDPFRFGGAALREFFCGAALLASLGAAVLLRSALGPRGGGPVTRAMGLLAAGALGGAAVLSGVLWAAAPYPPLRPLAAVFLSPTGNVRYEAPDGIRVEGPGRLQGEIVEFQVKSAFVSWPLLQVRQVLPLAVGLEPLAKPWVRNLLASGARRWTADGPHRPRVALREDTLFAPPGAYVLRESADGAGLVLAKPDEQR